MWTNVPSVPLYASPFPHVRSSSKSDQKRLQRVSRCTGVSVTLPIKKRKGDWCGGAGVAWVWLVVVGWGNRRGKRCFWTYVPSTKPQIEPAFSRKRDRFSIFPDRKGHEIARVLPEKCENMKNLWNFMEKKSFSIENAQKLTFPSDAEFLKQFQNNCSKINIFCSKLIFFVPNWLFLFQINYFCPKNTQFGALHYKAGRKSAPAVFLRTKPTHVDPPGTLVWSGPLAGTTNSYPTRGCVTYPARLIRG